jgi:fucose permease
MYFLETFIATTCRQFSGLHLLFLIADAKVYLATTIFVWLLAVVFYFARIPEISDDDMQQQQETVEGLIRHDQKPFFKQYRLFLAVWAQFMYCGAQGFFPNRYKTYMKYRSRRFLSTMQMKLLDSVTRNPPSCCPRHKDSSR